MFKTKIYCDRRIYDKRGKWYNPLSHNYENIFYYEKEHRTLVSTYVNGREELQATLTITVYGGKPFAKEDMITLETGETFKIVGFTPIFVETNPLVKDLLKPRVAETELVLE